MFADDTTLFASNRKALLGMIKDVKAALAEHGLNLNVDKCLIQTSSVTAPKKPIEIDGQCIPMVQATEGFKVLGTQFTLQGRTSAEIRSRMGAAWPMANETETLRRGFVCSMHALRKQRFGVMSHAYSHKARNEC